MKILCSYDFIFILINYNSIHWILVVIWRKRYEYDNLTNNFKGFFFESVKINFDSFNQTHELIIKIKYLINFIINIL